LVAEGERRLEPTGGSRGRLRAEVSLELRYRGTETALEVPWPRVGGQWLATDEASDSLRRGFEEAHERLFGYRRPDQMVEVCGVRAAVLREREAPPEQRLGGSDEPLAPLRLSPLWTGARFEQVPLYRRQQLRPGRRIDGPAIVIEPTGTLVVDRGFELSVDSQGGAWLAHRERVEPPPIDRSRDPIALGLFINHFGSIAEQMGEALRRTASSTNIRERLDFSCAVFDRQGSLVANAPHIPVHLGGMEQTVRALVQTVDDLRPGDGFATNDPARGGSHLPDITVVSPVFDDAGQLTFFVASRGHHADVGGITPGSMPPAARSLAEEGVVLDALRVVRAGRLDEAAWLDALRSGPHPARHPEQNSADLEAQLAANRTGARLLEELIAAHGRPTLQAYVGHIQDHAAEAVAAAIGRLPDGIHRFADRMDDGTPIAVELEVSGGRLTIDFEGTGPQSDGNLNAPRAVTTAAVLYALRLLVGKPLPLAGGCLRPVVVRVPPRCLLDPAADRAVAGGNVETSQRVVDVLLGALGLCAASQGTMNNVSFGSGRYAYYETLGGGVGAGPGFDGASAVHSHMTNTRITDPEVLEATYPVRLWEFAIRRGSGGAGAHRGGDGLVRAFEVLEPLTLSILSERRTVAPFGLQGGQPGARGRNLVDGVDIGGKASLELRPGAQVRIETPGGGGWGTPR
jgi:5-oxoprolinase (ATP-hydrolysing)